MLPVGGTFDIFVAFPIQEKKQGNIVSADTLKHRPLKVSMSFSNPFLW